MLYFSLFNIIITQHVITWAEDAQFLIIVNSGPLHSSTVSCSPFPFVGTILIECPYLDGGIGGLYSVGCRGVVAIMYTCRGNSINRDLSWKCGGLLLSSHSFKLAYWDCTHLNILNRLTPNTPKIWRFAFLLSIKRPLLGAFATSLLLWMLTNILNDFVKVLLPEAWSLMTLTLTTSLWRLTLSLTTSLWRLMTQWRLNVIKRAYLSLHWMSHYGPWRP